MNKKIGIAVGGVALLLSNVLLFCLAKERTVTFWVTVVFVWIAFASSLIIQMFTWKKADTADKQFVLFSSISVSYIYMTVQIPISVVFGVCSRTIPLNIAILVNAALLIIAWVFTLSGLVGNDHIQKINSRQKNHHTKL